MEERLPTELWIAAHVRQCATKGVPVYITRKGEPNAGTVIVKIVIRGMGCRVFNQFRSPEGKMGWFDLYEGQIVDETRADQYIKQARDRDPDVWVVEVEDVNGKNPFEGKIL